MSPTQSPPAGTLLLPAISSGPNSADPMRGQLILSLFTGAGLFDRAFEALGACVVSAGDILYGKDIRDFHAPAGRFDGVIGGPPCQVFSSATNLTGTDAINLIPEYLRVFEETKPKWAVMENIPNAISAGPGWEYSILRDWDCGGWTMRERPFWFYGLPACPVPSVRPGTPYYSVLASSYKTRTGNKIRRGKAGGTPALHQMLDAWEAAFLQGYSGLHWKIMAHQPADVSPTGRRCLATHMLGNGVPAAMANHVAGHVAYYLRHGECAAPVQVPLFEVAA